MCVSCIDTVVYLLPLYVPLFLKLRERNKPSIVLSSEASFRLCVKYCVVYCELYSTLLYYVVKLLVGTV
jgi:hypothetical protein